MFFRYLPLIFSLAPVGGRRRTRRGCRRPCSWPHGWPRAVPGASAALPHVSWPRAARQPRLIVPPPKLVSLLTSPQPAGRMPRGPSCVQVRAQVVRAAWSRLRRAPASAGARNFRGRRHLPLLGLRRRGEQAVIKARCAERPPPHTHLRAPQPPRPPHARIPHLPAALHRPRAALHASLPPHPLVP